MFLAKFLGPYGESLAEMLLANLHVKILGMHVYIVDASGLKETTHFSVGHTYVLRSYDLFVTNELVNLSYCGNLLEFKKAGRL